MFFKKKKTILFKVGNIFRNIINSDAFLEGYKAKTEPKFLKFQDNVIAESLSRVQLFEAPWTVAHQTPLSIRFLRQEYWSELPFPLPGDLATPGIEPRSPSLQADFLFLTTKLQGKLEDNTAGN